jgi:hypothetical protein
MGRLGEVPDFSFFLKISARAFQLRVLGGPPGIPGSYLGSFLGGDAMREIWRCALAVIVAALVLVLPQLAWGQEATDAERDEETRAERVGRPSSDATQDNLGLKIMLETSRTAQEDRAADREAAEAAESRKVGKMREKKQRTREQQEEERSEAWSNVGVQAATAVGVATGVAEAEEDEK